MPATELLHFPLLRLTRHLWQAKCTRVIQSGNVRGIYACYGGVKIYV